MKNNYIKSPLNYMGGKYKLLSQILPLFPNNIDTFVDLFCGGFNVGINVNANRIIGNDIDKWTIMLLKMFQEYTGKEIIEEVENIIDKYNLSKTNLYGYEYYGCNSSDGVGKYNKEKFIKLREDFNKNQDNIFLFYTTLIYSYNNIMQFNKDGIFTNSCSKRDFNDNIRKNLLNFCNKLHSSNNVIFTNNNYKELKIEFSTNDFVYIDPPYLLSIASYNKMNKWNIEFEYKLLDYCDKLNENNIKFALSNVTEHKGNKNNILIEWSKKYNIHYLNYNYNNCNYKNNNKNNKTIEVLITNY